MTIGEKIKKYRLEKNLSQKQVAIRAGMSEPAIRNYELGNRTPSDKQIEKIALALDVSPFALSNPNLDSYVGVMHALFYLEDEYGLVPDEIDGQFCLKFKDRFSTASSNLESWYKEYRNMQEASPDKAEEVHAYYNEWKQSYPRLSAEQTSSALRSRRKKNE
ncbi:MAG: helix-turn-helix domain-containing protein [Clostridia bacterium]|nr:helix-turn-helix domain-containing protein [Clostridia bacterium]